MGTLTAELTTDLVQMGPVEDRWRELAVKRSNGFITPEWFRSWWEGHRESSSPLISVARRADGSVAGVMPLVLDTSSLPRAIRFAGASIGDHFHPAAEAADEADVAAATMTALERAGLDRSMVLLEHADSDGEWWRGMRSHSPIRRAIVEQQQTRAYYIDLRERDWDSYLAARSRNFRQKVGRSERRLLREHGMTVRSADQRTLDADLNELFRLHDLRRDPLGGSSLRGAGRHSVRSFAREAHQQGWLRLLTLEADGGPVASFLGWRAGNCYVHYQSGFDPAWSHRSVGFVLTALTVRSAIEEGATKFDFLLGTEEWKSRFTDESRPSQTSIVLRARRPVWALVAAHAQARKLAERIENRHRLRSLARSMHVLIPTARRS
jgi:CelD/BcsL family acetyltransferase involved in cellulose biosynthesis